MEVVLDIESAQHLNLNLDPYTAADGKRVVRICRGAVGLANLNDFEVSSWLSA